MNQSVLWNVVPGCFSPWHTKVTPPFVLTLTNPPRDVNLDGSTCWHPGGDCIAQWFNQHPDTQTWAQRVTRMAWIRRCWQVDRLTWGNYVRCEVFGKTYGRNTLRQPQQGQGQQHIHRYTYIYIYIVVRTRRWQSSTCLLQLLGPGWRQD